MAFVDYFIHNEFDSDYTMESRVLGTGESCDPVRTAIHCQTGSKHAVKTLSSSNLEIARGEADIHHSLDHPNIVRLQKVYQTKESVHLVMECLEGGELFDRLAEGGKLSEEAVKLVLSQALSATAYLHQQGVAHRDLKLENMVYQSSGGEQLKIIDFGLACRFQQGSPKMIGHCGTLEYIAPEVFAGSYDEKVDVWSLGVIAYMLLCGGLTPWSSCDSETRDMIRAGAPHFSKTHFAPLSEGAKDFVRRLLMADPAARLSAEGALHHPWLSSQHISMKVPKTMQSIEPDLYQAARRVAAERFSKDHQSYGVVREMEVRRGKRNGQECIAGVSACILSLLSFSIFNSDFRSD